MKAHYSGPELGQGFDSFAVEGQSFGSNRDGAWIDSEFCKVRRKRGAPDRFPLDAELGVGMAEEVHIERLRGVRTDRCELLTHVVQAEHRARKRAKPTCVGHRHCKCTALNTRHRGLNDRERDSKELLQSHSHIRKCHSYSRLQPREWLSPTGCTGACATRLTVRLQLRRLIMTPAAVGCKPSGIALRLIDSPEVIAVSKHSMASASGRKWA